MLSERVRGEFKRFSSVELIKRYSFKYNHYLTQSHKILTK